MSERAPAHGSFRRRGSGGEERLVYDTDAGGIATGAWPNLMKLARRTATALAATLLPPKTPLLLTHPGLIDRYQLVELLRSLVEAAKDDAAEPILLLVPGHERGVPKIGDMLIPDLLPGQWTWIPEGVDRQHSCSSPQGSVRDAHRPDLPQPCAPMDPRRPPGLVPPPPGL